MKRIVSFLLAFCLVISFSIKAFSTHSESVSTEEEAIAAELFKSGKYPEAKKIFGQLGLNDLVKECDYQWAIMQAEEDHFESAIDLLERLAETDYNDSEDLLTRVKVGYVHHLLGTFSTQNYRAAYLVAFELAKTGYSDADQLLEETVSTIFADQLLEETISTIFEKGVETYQAKNYTIAYQLFAAIRPTELDRVVPYYALSCIHANMPIREEEYEVLVSNLDLEDTREALLYGKIPAVQFLKGEWQDASGLRFALAEDGSLTDELPRVNPEAGNWVIVDGVLKVYTNSSKTRIDDQVIRILFANRIEIFCHADGKTYTLNREVR